MRSTSYTYCLFCGYLDKFDRKKPAHILLTITSATFEENLKEAICKRKPKDEWKEMVKQSVYHVKCRCNFFTPRLNIPKLFASTPPVKKDDVLNPLTMKHLIKFVHIWKVKVTKQ